MYCPSLDGEAPRLGAVDLQRNFTKPGFGSTFLSFSVTEAEEVAQFSAKFDMLFQLPK